jgi:threonine dehydrogenase-like Zn-dependent dehydrogenase
MTTRCPFSDPQDPVSRVSKIRGQDPPDPVPCGACAQGEYDMCRNGHYTELDNKEIDGFGAQMWCTEPG